jgi:hypothetical protein
VLRELTNNSKSKRVEIDCEIFSHRQIEPKECLGQLWPTSVTFLPEVTIVQRLHHMFAVQHKIYERFPPQFTYPCPLGPEHILFYKDGERVFSLVHTVDPFLSRWETCHPTLHDIEYFETKEDAFKEIMQTLYSEERVKRKKSIAQ